MTQMFLKVLWSFLLLNFATVQVSPVRRDTGKATLKISTKSIPLALETLVKDQARAQALKQLPHLREHTSSSRSFSATNAAVFYMAEVGVGTPPPDKPYVCRLSYPLKDYRHPSDQYQKFY